ncbi:hypothetical protein PACTADRAFT_48332 [Pachysolen tannophilus NRRL Y-2460]|uniref:DUF985 domain-containing protein n=1 Tax=Pachysolen tannophilus NRRL Y-2460 TaxID=669874 RepID=A0A1E4U3N3_PACTA|nr:hypothetical protein PACTADRAFT_48332 [Pachysolen tannophilus NRRL Y-2460]
MSESIYDLESATIDSIRDCNIAIEEPEYVTKKIKRSTQTQALIDSLKLMGHPEGGFFKETDRSPFTMASPYFNNPEIKSDSTTAKTPTRSYSTLIYYLITPEAPLGRLHRNHSRIIHIWQGGRGQYVLIYPNGEIKTFKVGPNIEKGEVMQWVVPGGVYKASFLVPEDEDTGESEHDKLLISEVVVPGFEFEDHRFMKDLTELESLVGKDKASNLKWLLGN